MWTTAPEHPAARPRPRCQCANDIISLTGPSPSMPHPPSPSPPPESHPVVPYSSRLLRGTYSCTVPRNNHISLVLVAATLQLPHPPPLNPTPFFFFYFALRKHKRQRHTKSTGWDWIPLSSAAASHFASHRIAVQRIESCIHPSLSPTFPKSVGCGKR